MNSILTIIFIFFRALSLFLLGVAIVAAVIHTVKYIFKKHDVDTVSEITIICIALAILVSWAVTLN